LIVRVRVQLVERNRVEQRDAEDAGVDACALLPPSGVPDIASGRSSTDYIVRRPLKNG